MPDNLIRFLLILAILPLIIYCVVMAAAHALVGAYHDFMDAWHGPQGTIFKRWDFWH